jgi:hypothetical protein
LKDALITRWPGERGDEFVDQLLVDGLTGGEQAVPDDAEDDVGHRAGGRHRWEVAARRGTVENDAECVSAALEKRGAEPFAEIGVDLCFGHESAEYLDDALVAAEREARGQKRS